MNFLSTEQLAEKIPYAPKVIERMARNGRLPAYKMGKRWMFIESEVEEFIKSHRYEPEDSVNEVVSEIIEGMRRRK